MNVRRKREKVKEDRKLGEETEKRKVQWGFVVCLTVHHRYK